MGKDAQVAARFADGTDEGRLQYEPPKLLFRGAQRRVFEGEALRLDRTNAAAQHAIRLLQPKSD